MEIFGVDLARIDLQGWIASARDFAVPRLLQSAGLLILAAIVYVIARWMLQRIERHLTGRTETQFDDMIAELIRRAVLTSVGFWALWRLVLIWELERTAQALVAVWIVALSLPASRFVADLLELLERRVAPRTRTRLDDTALPLLNKVVYGLVVVVAVLIALDFVGINITPLLAGAGVAGLAISLAAKDTLSNFIAGIQLILDRPFQVGDRIELWDAPSDTAAWGDVTEIGMRATKIRNPDNLVFVIPNNEIMRRDIINYTASGSHIRLRIPIGIAYDADGRLAKKLALEVAGGVEGVMEDPAPKIITRTFGESAVNLELRVWISDGRRRRDIGDEITDRVKAVYDDNGIEIPFPKRDLYLKQAPDGWGPAGPAPAGKETEGSEAREAAGDPESREAAGSPERRAEETAGEGDGGER